MVILQGLTVRWTGLFGTGMMTNSKIALTESVDTIILGRKMTDGLFHIGQI